MYIATLYIVFYLLICFKLVSNCLQFNGSFNQSPLDRFPVTTLPLPHIAMSVLYCAYAAYTLTATVALVDVVVFN